MAEELDVEKCNFQNFWSPWPWPWIGSYGIPSCISHDLYLHIKFHWNRKNFCGWTVLRT